jgi:hypothetical protein
MSIVDAAVPVPDRCVAFCRRCARPISCRTRPSDHESYPATETEYS